MRACEKSFQKEKFVTRDTQYYKGPFYDNICLAMGIIYDVRECNGPDGKEAKAITTISIMRAKLVN